MLVNLKKKSKKNSFSTHGSHANKCFKIIHNDVWGMALVTSHVHYKYFVTFIDYFNRFT